MEPHQFQQPRYEWDTPCTELLHVRLVHRYINRGRIARPGGWAEYNYRKISPEVSKATPEPPGLYMCKRAGSAVQRKRGVYYSIVAVVRWKMLKTSLRWVPVGEGEAAGEDWRGWRWQTIFIASHQRPLPLTRTWPSTAFQGLNAIDLGSVYTIC